MDGPWLNNSHSHRRNQPWRTFGKASEFVDPGPAKTWVLIDEDEYSINDAGFAVGVEQDEWIDRPGTYHNGACGFAFADGHSEIHKWIDGRTKVIKVEAKHGDLPPLKRHEDPHPHLERTLHSLRDEVMESL